MGSAASIDSFHTLQLDYASLKASNLDFSSAYAALQEKLKAGQALDGGNGASIPFLAIRQLSQNLRNQDRLERTKRKVLKSRSLPDNLRYRHPERDVDRELVAVKDDLEMADVALITDHEFLGEEPVVKKPTESKEGEEKKKKKKPNLVLQLTSDKGSSGLLGAESPAYPCAPQRPKSPSQDMRVSPRGTLYMGHMKVLETGIVPDRDAKASPGNVFEQVRRHFVEEHGDYVAHMDAAGHYLFTQQRHASIAEEEPLLPALGGKKDFIEISTLGSGASGVVTEAIHAPSLTLVALKILPIYNQEKRQHVSRELTVLYKNLTDMRLINESLEEEDTTAPQRAGDSPSPRDAPQGSTNKRCINVLSLYNAFIDPRAGTVNLVVEYMDGGSLEDLVKQGGCQDERVLADIAFQTLNGLRFLHNNKNVHRDIKPANILCSSTGLIKIADFGISKALDKTTGFANSFVGTVCYMSPERITGESHSFSCDIWSLGLTLLAVAKGRFPISLKLSQAGAAAADELSDSSSPQIIGGPGGYWAMIKAICDDDPPVAGADFSTHFNAFISYCLRKEPADRYTASELMETSFLLAAAPQLQAAPRPPGDELSKASPLTAAHITTAAIARKASTDAAPAVRGAAALGVDLQDDVRLSAADLLSEEENRIAYAVKMEHLERVLERLAERLTMPTKEPLESLGDGAKDGPLSSESMDNMFLQASPVPKKEPWKDNKDDKSATLTRSILKHNSNNNNNNNSNINNTTNNNNNVNNMNTAHDNLSASARSVHFHEPSTDKLALSKNKGNLRSRKNLKNLELALIVDEEEDDGIQRQLPKTSSYFLASKSKDDLQLDQAPAPAPPPDVIDYSKMIPKFDRAGLSKWRHLAQQLHLPLPLVLLAARARLGSLMDLDDNATQ